MNLSYFIAQRYLVKQKGAFSSFIIRLGIVATALSVAVMILAMAFISGFKFAVREKLYSVMGHVHVELFDPTNSNTATLEPITMNKQLEAQILHVPHVVQVLPFASRPAIIQVHGTMEGIQLKGVTKDYHLLTGATQTGGIDYSDTNYSKQVILSQTTANRLDVSKGDSIQLYFLEPGATFPRIRKVQVSGIYHSGMDDIDKAYALCDLRLLQRINNWDPDQINSYQVNLDDARYSDTVANYIFEKYLHDPTNPLHVYTMYDIFPNIFDWLDVQDVNGTIILIIMGIVAMINLATVLVILIVEQARMIGILKALGMPFREMQLMFLYFAGMIAGSGIVLGNVFALSFGWLQQKYGFMPLKEEQYFMKQVPVKIVWWHVAVIDVSTLLLCILCMLLPTLYIRRISPARVLQFK